MKTVSMGRLIIGEGMPKTCVPIVGKDIDSVCCALAAIKNSKALPDMIEFRADWYEGIENADSLNTVLKKIREDLPDIPVLFTIRTAKEGGERAFSYKEYHDILLMAAGNGLVDAVDVEAFSYCVGNCQGGKAVLAANGSLASVQEHEAKGETGQKEIERLMQQLKESGCVVVASNHDFYATPSEEEIVSRLKCMQEMGADIAKIAVMPKDAQDVLKLLSATAQVSSDEQMCPVITMSMAGQGLVSRLSGEIFGSAVTFACVGQASAPGQIELEQLQNILQVVHLAG